MAKAQAAPKGAWICGTLELVGPAQFTHLIRGPNDPERSSREERKGQTLRWRERRKLPVAGFVKEILALLADGKPRTLHAMAVTLLDEDGDMHLGSPLDQALWQLVGECRVEHTTVAPILFRLVKKGAKGKPQHRRMGGEAEAALEKMEDDGKVWVFAYGPDDAKGLSRRLKRPVKTMAAWANGVERRYVRDVEGVSLLPCSKSFVYGGAARVTRAELVRLVPEDRRRTIGITLHPSADAATAMNLPDGRYTPEAFAYEAASRTFVPPSPTLLAAVRRNVASHWGEERAKADVDDALVAVAARAAARKLPMRKRLLALADDAFSAVTNGEHHAPARLKEMWDLVATHHDWEKLGYTVRAWRWRSGEPHHVLHELVPVRGSSLPSLVAMDSHGIRDLAEAFDVPMPSWARETYPAPGGAPEAPPPTAKRKKTSNAKSLPKGDRGKNWPKDLLALERIAESSISRPDLKKRASALVKSTELYPWNYQVLQWLDPRTKEVIVEYKPLVQGLPRLTATTYAEQVAIHEALGAPVKPKGSDEHTKAPRPLRGGGQERHRPEALVTHAKKVYLMVNGSKNSIAASLWALMQGRLDATVVFLTSTGCPAVTRSYVRTFAKAFNLTFVERAKAPTDGVLVTGRRTGFKVEGRDKVEGREAAPFAGATDAQVWEMLDSTGIRPHPGYMLGVNDPCPKTKGALEAAAKKPWNHLEAIIAASVVDTGDFPAEMLFFGPGEKRVMP